jgi:iron(III) transport system ATP-binding protein
MTAVLVTHDQAEALSMGREVAVLQSGRLVQTATPADLYRAPADLEVARFVGEALVVPGRVHDGVAECALGRLPFHGTAAEGPVQVMVRPEQIRVGRTGLEAAPGGRGFAAEVVGRSYFGPDTVVRLALADGSGTEVVSRTFDHDLPGEGELVECVVQGRVAVYPAAGPER